MKMPARNPTRVIRGPRWPWAVLLAAALLPACKRSEVECEPRAFLRVIEPERKTGALPFSIDRLGPEVNESELVLALKPVFVTLREGDRVETDWTGFDTWYGGDFIYSPEEGLARNVRDASDVLPMKRLSDGRLLVGFQSVTCAIDMKTRRHCFDLPDYGTDEQPFVADMKCRRPWIWEKR